MDANQYRVTKRLAEDEDKLLVLAKCVYKLMGAAGVRCEDHNLSREEWDALQYQLAEAFDFKVYE